MQPLSTVRLVTFRLERQLERRKMAGGCPDARLVESGQGNRRTFDRDNRWDALAFTVLRVPVASSLHRFVW
jgi:hypothetical protein